jgi:hypothetical protein
MQDFFRNLLRLEKPIHALLSRHCGAQEGDCTTPERSSHHVQQHFKPGIAEPVSGREMSGSDYKLLRLQEQTQEIHTRSVILVGSKLCETSSI